MDQLRVHRLKKRYPLEAAQLKESDEAASTGMLLAILDLDSTLGFAVTEYVETMSGELPRDIFFLMYGVLDKFIAKVDGMFPGLSEEEKQEIKQLVRSKSRE